jgi:hypothetical protein
VLEIRQRTHLWLSVFGECLKHTYSVTSSYVILVTSFGDGSSFGAPAGLREALLLLVSIWSHIHGFIEPIARESTSPGEDSTGASAEREGGFDPQLKGMRARGECKGAREVLARHGRTTQPWGAPGGVLRTQRTTQPGWMCSFDDI